MTYPVVEHYVSLPGLQLIDQRGSVGNVLGRPSARPYGPAQL